MCKNLFLGASKYVSGRTACATHSFRVDLIADSFAIAFTAFRIILTTACQRINSLAAYFATKAEPRRLPSVLECPASIPSSNVESAHSSPSPPIRVLVVAARFLPDLGGIENHIYEITSRIAKRSDIQITVLTTDRSGSLPVREAFGGFTVVRCRSYPRNRDYYISPGIYQHIFNTHYDLIHCEGIHTAVPIFAMIAARRRQIPYIVTLHTGGHSLRFRNRLRSIQWRMLAPLLRDAALVIAVSRFEQEIFLKACRLDLSQFTIIRNGGDLPVDGCQFDAIPDHIVASGRLERYKGHQRIVEALPIVQRSIPGATLRILGSGPYEKDLKALVKRVGIEGSVTIEYIPPEDRRRMAEALGKAAVFASLSEYEANPVAVMEALALRIPTVGLDTAGIGDLVADGLVRGIPKHASAAAVAEVLVAALSRTTPTTGTGALPSWDTAASDTVSVYLNAAGANLKHRRPRDA